MKTKNIFLTVALALCTTFAFAQEITGSSHDFSAASWNASTSGEICNACHSPHQGTGDLAAPLWNRGTTIGTFIAYTSTTFTASATNTASGGSGAAYSATPSGVSLLCLTCHDGVQLLDAYGGGDLATTMTTLAPAAVRNGGSDEHPISIAYTTELISIDGGLEDFATASARLSADGTVECSSCHDVHGSFDNTKGNGLLAATNAGSLMCLTCHAK